MKKLLGLFLLLTVIATPSFAQDAFPIQSAQIVNAPDVSAWPVTTNISSVTFSGYSTSVKFSKQDGPNRWPDVTPPGWEGPLQYTLWLFVKNGDTWAGSAFIQFWYGRDASGNPGDPDVPSLYAKNWYYAQRWAPVYGHGPIRPGEQIGFMVTSGNQRDKVGPNSVQERSNIVVFAATDTGVITFGAPAPEPVPVPTPTPEPVPVPQPTPPPFDPASVYARMDSLEAQLAALASRVTVLEARPVFTTCVASIFGMGVSCSLR